MFFLLLCREAKEETANVTDTTTTTPATESESIKGKKDEEEFLVPVDSSTDVGIMKFQPQNVEFKDLRAKPEGGENPNKLVSWLTEAEINEVYVLEFVFYIVGRIAPPTNISFLVDAARQSQFSFSRLS